MVGVGGGLLWRWLDISAGRSHVKVNRVVTSSYGQEN